MKSILVILAVSSLSSLADAFHPVLQGFHCRSLTLLHSTKDTSAVDWKRAKHCAEHFGTCDVDEVEDLYKRKWWIVWSILYAYIARLSFNGSSCLTHSHTEAHKERIQHQLFGGVDLQHESSTEMEHRIIEEELELQLNLLEKEHDMAQQEVNLFPEDMITELPHLYEHVHADHTEPIPSRLLHQAEHQLIQQESTMGEDTLETLAMCAVVLGLVFLPQLLN